MCYLSVKTLTTEGTITSSDATVPPQAEYYGLHLSGKPTHQGGALDIDSEGNVWTVIPASAFSIKGLTINKWAGESGANISPSNTSMGSYQVVAGRLQAFGIRRSDNKMFLSWSPLLSDRAPKADSIITVWDREMHLLDQIEYTRDIPIPASASGPDPVVWKFLSAHPYMSSGFAGSDSTFTLVGFVAFPGEIFGHDYFQITYLYPVILRFSVSNTGSLMQVFEHIETKHPFPLDVMSTNFSLAVSTGRNSETLVSATPPPYIRSAKAIYALNSSGTDGSWVNLPRLDTKMRPDIPDPCKLTQSEERQLSSFVYNIAYDKFVYSAPWLGYYSGSGCAEMVEGILTRSFGRMTAFEFASYLPWHLYLPDIRLYSPKIEALFPTWPPSLTPPLPAPPPCLVCFSTPFVIGSIYNTPFVFEAPRTIEAAGTLDAFHPASIGFTLQTGPAFVPIFNVLTNNGTSVMHGVAYEYFGNRVFDARNVLWALDGNTFRENDFGGMIGGPLARTSTSYLASYEGNRLGESAVYTSEALRDIAAINSFRTGLGLSAEKLNQIRPADYDHVLIKLDHQLTRLNALTATYLFSDARLRNQSPLDDGFDLPSGFKDNFVRHQSGMVLLTSTLTNNLVNQVRGPIRAVHP
jgi:hypothetical protein